MDSKAKETIRKWVQDVHDSAHKSNTVGKDEITWEEYNYNMGQMDMADAILAQLDRWFDEK